MDESQSASVPAPLDPLMQQLGELLRKDIERRGWTFIIQDKELTPEEVSSPTGLLSILAYQATQFYKTLTQHELPLYYYPNDDSVCGISPAVSEAQNSTFGMWAHFIHYTLEDWALRYPEQIKRKEPIPLDDLYSLWHEASVRQELVFKSPPSPSPDKSSRPASGSRA